MTEAAEHHATQEGVTVIGAGHEGSHLVPHLARDPSVKHLIIVDPDTYFSAENLSQDFSPSENGQKKAIILSRRARRIRPNGDLQVEAFVARAEDVPLGRLRSKVICSCVDSLISRAAINRIAFRLNIPLVDAGIQAQGLLARIEVHIPGADAPCIECAWNTSDFERINQSYSCDGRLKEPSPTRAPSALGGLAAAHQALQCGKLLHRNAGIDESLAGKQLVVEGRFHNQFVNKLRKNLACRFDHQIWLIQKAPDSVRTVGDLFEYGRKLLGGEFPAISADGKSWVTRLVCRLCGHQARTLRLQGRIGARLRSCEQCNGEMEPVGFHLRPRLEMRSASGRLLARPLRHLGLCAGDVLTLIGAHGVRHVELCQSQQAGGN